MATTALDRAAEARASAPARVHPRAWIVSELYYPEETSTGYFVTRIAEALSVDRSVGAICAQPTYSARGTRAPARETHGGVQIRRCRATTLNKDVLPFRVINVLTISLSLAAHVWRAARRGDSVLVVTNPPLLPFLTSIACRARGARCILLIHDVYPEALVAAGLLRANSMATSILTGLTRWLYRRVDRISVVGRDMEALVRRKIGGDEGHAGRVTMIPNWAEPDLVAATPADERGGNALLREHHLEDRFVVQYAGNIGRVHAIDTLLETARRLATRAPDVHFLFIGSGARRGWIADAIANEGLPNVTLLPPRPRRDQQTFLSACDVAVMAFVPGMSGVGVPSRLYNILAVGKPVIGALDDDSEPARTIREHAAGWVVPPGDAEALAGAILEARADPVRVAEMGHRARAAAEGPYSIGCAMNAYRALLDHLSDG